jgi:hypothetical protein
MNYKNDKELKAENQRWADYAKNSMVESHIHYT